MALLRFKMDKTFMRFDVSTQKSDDCERVKEDSVWREREWEDKKRKDEFSVLFRWYDFNLNMSK